MTGWSTFEPAEVLEQFTEAEAATLKNIKGGTDTLGQIVLRVIDQVRQSYADGGREVDDTGGTVPVGEKLRAIAIARWELLISYPMLKSMQTEERKKAAADARDYFDKIAIGDFKASLGAQLVTRPDPARAGTRRKLDGLI